jgi:hypothetical protein
MHTITRLFPCHSPRPAQVVLRPCRLGSAGDADMGLSQLPKLQGLFLGGTARGDLVSASRTQGEVWRVGITTFLTPDAAAMLARSFNSGAAPAGQQQQQQPAAGAGEQRSSFLVAVKIQPGPSLAQTSQLASLGRALAAYEAVVVWLQCEGEACPSSVNALLQPVAAQLTALEVVGAGAGGVLEALQRLALPCLEELQLEVGLGGCAPGAVMAVAGLDAPRLAFIVLEAAITGSRADAVAAVTALAVGRPRPVGPDGRPAGLRVEVSQAALSDEELGSVCRAVPTTRALWAEVLRPS